MTKPKPKPTPKPVVTSTHSISSYIRQVSRSELPEDCVLFIVAMLCEKMGEESEDASIGIDNQDIQTISERLGWHYAKTVSILGHCIKSGYVCQLSQDPAIFGFDF